MHSLGNTRGLRLVSLVALFSLIHAKADVILVPEATTSNVSAFSGSSLAALTDGSGLSATVAAGSDAAAALSVTHENEVLSQSYVTPANGSDYFVAGTVPVLTFTFDAAFDAVNSIILWNYASGTGLSGIPQDNALKTFSLEFFSDAGATVSLGNVTGLTAAASFPVSGPGSSEQIAQRLFFTDGASFDDVRAIRMTLLDNYAGQPGGAGGDRVGLSEVRFTAVPEAETGVTAAVLLAVCAFRRRRR